METVTCAEIGGNIANLVAQVASSSNPLVIAGEKEQSAVLLSLSEFQSLQETLYLLSHPANTAHLRRSIADLESGKGIEVDLSEFLSSGI